MVPPVTLGEPLQKNTKPGLVEYFYTELKMSFLLLSEGISCSDAESFLGKLALRYPLGTVVNPLLLISPCSLCDAHRTIIPLGKIN